MFLGCNAGVLRTGGKGSGWTDVSAGLPPGGVTSLAIEGSTVYAGVWNAGIWKRPLEEIVTGFDEDPARELPGAFRLEQNYPNPFNPTTLVSFHLPAGQTGSPVAREVKLSVYDLLGREVAVLVNERKAPGNYQVTFDPAGLSSGVYLCRLIAGRVVLTRTMILVR